MQVLNSIPFHVDRKALLARLHLDADNDFAAEILDLAERAEKVGRPKAIYGSVAIDKKHDDGIEVNGVRFTSHAMAKTLQKTDRIYPYVCTCGMELDALPVEDDGGFGQFGLDIIKEMALFQAAGALNQQLVKEFKLEKKAAMNPGSGDRRLWPIEEQAHLFKLLGDVHAAIGVTLTGSFLMQPNKTVSGFYFKVDHEYHNCELCKREACPNRRAPFNADLWAERMETDKACG